MVPLGVACSVRPDRGAKVNLEGAACTVPFGVARTVPLGVARTVPTEGGVHGTLEVACFVLWGARARYLRKGGCIVPLRAACIVALEGACK